ncbi:MAG: CotH kinase family protein, partial [Myxococcota bacterium]|nr:CotH kinase family protein [Myxococcota bacterium]
PEPDDAIAPIFDQTVLRTFELRLDEDNLAYLDANPTAEEYVPGTLIYDGQEYGPVGIRYKGSFGSFKGCTENDLGWEMSGAKTCPNLNFKVSFNAYDPDGRFFGVKKLQFHAMRQDDSFMRERLGYWLFRQMGVAAPRAVHVRLWVNGEIAGVFLNVEHIDGRFTESRFADGDGNLYKEVWPTTLSGEGTSEAALLEGLRTHKDDDPSVDRTRRFGEAVAVEDGDSRAQTLRAWLSIENTLAYIAVDRTIRADDGLFHYYCFAGTCFNHNFFLYEEARSDRLWFIPWDLDNAFVVGGSLATDTDDFLRVSARWNDDTVSCQATGGFLVLVPGQVAPACDPLLNGLGCYYTPSYHDAVQTLLEGPFSAEVVDEMIERWSSQIGSTIQAGHTANSERPSISDWQTALADLRTRIEILRAQAVDELEIPAPDITDVEATSDPGPVIWPDIVLNEVAAEGGPADWIELLNRGDEVAALGGWLLTDDDPAHLRVLEIDRVLAPGEHLLLVRDTIEGFAFGLGSEDMVHLHAPDGTLVDSTAWESGQSDTLRAWGRMPDGVGAWMTLATPSPGEANVENQDQVCGNGTVDLGEVCDGDDLQGMTCQGLNVAGGQLGCSTTCDQVDTGGCLAPSRVIVINEVSSSGDDPIELYNPGSLSVSLSGWTLTDDNDTPSKGAYVFANGAILPPGAFWLLEKGVDHAFGLGDEDAVKLRNESGVLVDMLAWPEGGADVSYCLSPNGGEAALSCDEATFGASND